MYELNYYEIYKNCKDISFLRKKIINSVNEIGIKPTAKKFNTTVKTVKKLLKKCEKCKKVGKLKKLSQLKPYKTCLY